MKSVQLQQNAALRQMAMAGQQQRFSTKRESDYANKLGGEVGSQLSQLTNIGKLIS